ncbi:putative quinol monooxygenase YgiN [Halomonas sp. THAF5a]|uniref:putative quinol monooxygenase n=1 Tax=Halomonas sp. THAF5a TaxID=2587844 RepID=UPI0012696802|nr:putative quinol monooxygenase [Halomonas sp. THAF5a]QFU01097.1 putative quinol monooxygenase YgiN [Halomonas sp. THAF5a]
MLWVIATITTAPGHDKDVLNALRDVAPTVRQEAGCQLYQPSQDHPEGLTADAPPRRDTVTVIEAWDSRQALDDHLATPHMTRFGEQTADWVVDRDIRLLTPH